MDENWSRGTRKSGFGSDRGRQPTILNYVDADYHYVMFGCSF
jgi:hypothetical protein